MAQPLVPSASAAAVWLLHDAGFGGLSPFLAQDWMPDDPDIGDLVVAVFEYPGTTHMGQVLDGAPRTFHARLQVRTRASDSDYATSRQLCTRAWRLLSAVDGVTVTAAQLLQVFADTPADDQRDVRLLACVPTDQPTLALRDDSDRVTFTCNLDAHVEVPR